MKTVQLFNVCLKCSFDHFDFVRELCSLYGGFFNSDLTILSVIFSSLTIDEVRAIVTRVYGFLDEPVLEISVIRDKTGNIVYFNPETRMPYVEKEQEE